MPRELNLGWLRRLELNPEPISWLPTPLTRTDLNGFLATELHPALLIENKQKKQYQTRVFPYGVPGPNNENRIYPYDKIAKQKHRCSFESIP